MNIIVKQLKAHNILTYFLSCCLANIFLVYSLWNNIDSLYLILSIFISVIAHLTTITVIFLNKRSRKHIFGNSYMEYYPANNILYMSKEMSEIGDIESILIQEEILSNGDTLSIKKIIENLEGNNFPKSLDLEIKEKYYKVIITTNPVSKIIVITFIDISDEFAKYLNMGVGYKQVLEEKEKLRTMLDNIPVAVWSRNKNMEIVYFNNAYSNIVFGYQKPFDQELLEIDKSAILSAQKAFLENATKVSERPIIVESKRYIYQITDIPLVQHGMVVSVAWDVTNKDLIQKELQEVLLSHQNLLESSSNACMIIGADGKLKYYNNALVKFWGPDEDLLSHETTHEEILDHLYTRRKLPEQYNYAKFKKERTSLTHSLTAPREDLFYLPDGKCLRCVVIPHAGNALLFTYEDVTEKLSLERLNHTLTAVQKFTIDHLQEGICVFNETGDLELINAGMTKFWGLDPALEGQKVNLSDIIEKILGECSTEIELEELRDAFARVMVSRIAAQQTIKSFNGNIIHRSMTPLPNRGIMVSDLDVTDSVIVQNALMEKNQALIYVDKIKSEFLANMSYELRNPLTSIIGQSQLLLFHEVENLSTIQKNRIKDLIRASEDLSKLVDDAIEITTISSGYVELDVEEFDLVEVISSMISEFADQLFDMNIAYSFEYDEGKIICISDKSKVKHALTKLLENSIYRSKNVRKINIELRVKGDSYLLSIADDGPRVDENVSNKKPTRSAGLRYILARAIINLLNGKISNEFSKDTEMTSFIMELPKSAS